MTMKQSKNITLDMGGGGAKSAEIISEIRKILGPVGKWKNTGDDGAVFELPSQPLRPDDYIGTPPLIKGRGTGHHIKRQLASRQNRAGRDQIAFVAVSVKFVHRENRNTRFQARASRILADVSGGAKIQFAGRSRHGSLGFQNHTARVF